MASVVGREGLRQIDRQYLEFADRFENDLVRQAAPRTLEESMTIGWEVLRLLPAAELGRLSSEQISRNIGSADDADSGA